MRKLAAIREIKNILPIENADNLELALIDGWQAVVVKNTFSKGEKVVYCEIDSFLPIKKEYEFLRKGCFKTLNEVDGFRIKTIKLRGCLSQGLVLKLTEETESLEVGTDVSELLGIMKYEQPETFKDGKSTGKNFPTFFSKTEEPRIQNLLDNYETLKTKNWTITEKLDGTSFSFYKYNEKCGICSRNLELTTEDSVYSYIADKYCLKDLVQEGVVIQGEILAPKVQKNRYKMAEPELFLFSMFFIDTQMYIPFPLMSMWAESYNIPCVPLIDICGELPENMEDLLLNAEGKSVLNSTTDREGLVYVNIQKGQKQSFKVISNSFLLKE